jgi:bifunctional non-homologous end joining protein LigD
MGLRTYAAKRRFDVTAEPGAVVPPRRRAAALRFVVQKHRASHLHYDFRLEWDGVLLSWAVPKGPSLDPALKRLAMAVEDHPIAYADFEGIIPPGEYGGGTVMVWDRGTYQAEERDVGRGLRAGEIKFTLAGEKLKGAWVLVRTGGKRQRGWLLLKRRDRFARRSDVTARAPRSVLSNRLMTEIAYAEGGDVEAAASADPPSALRALLRRRHSPVARRSAGRRAATTRR